VEGPAGRSGGAGRAGGFFRNRCGAGLPASRYNVAIGLTQRQEDATARQAASLWSRWLTMQAVKGLDMEKWLCWGSMGAAGLLLLLFLLDLFLSVPFGGISKAVDVMSILASALVLYLAYDAFKDLR
jgi:hypothetical protein